MEGRHAMDIVILSRNNIRKTTSRETEPQYKVDNP